ncbi:MAG: urease accessory UreF family protein [Pseudomonadota bacterium]
MVTAEPIHMNTGAQLTMIIDEKLLTLVQWLSPSYPIGSFAWSHGLESAIADGWVKTPADLAEWLTDLVTHGALRSDAILVSLAYRCNYVEALEALNAVARAFAASKERIEEAALQGAAFAKLSRDVWGLDLPDLLLPLAVGSAAKKMRLEQGALISVYCHGVLSNLILAAQRLAPVGQSDGQRVLADMAAQCTILAGVAVDAELEDIYSNCFLSDIASMRHETLHTRLFRS